MTYAIVDSLLASILPRRCGLCGQASGALNSCEACRGDLPWNNRPCHQCGAPLPLSCQSVACGRCRVSTAAIHRVMSALIYEYPVDRLIAGAKFQGRIDFARVLGEWLGLYLEARQTIDPFRLPDHIFPVPLHRKRLAARGFNQALEIARPVAELLNVPLNGSGCRRVRDTPEQTSLSGVARRRNTRDAFEASDDVFDKRIAVIDDVITTGSTADAMAKALCAAGAKEVLVFTVARTMPRASAA